VSGDHGISGIQFYHDDYATYVLEASSDLVTWSRKAYLYGDPGTTTWMNANLSQWGRFFRLGYVAYGHLPFTGLPPLDVGPALARKTSIKRTTIAAPTAVLPATVGLQKGRLNLAFNTAPGHRYQVAVYDRGRLVWSAQTVATQNRTAVTLSSSGLPALGLIQTTEVH